MEIHVYNRMKLSGLCGVFTLMFEHLYSNIKGRATSKVYLLFLNGLGKISLTEHQLSLINSLFARPDKLNIRKTDMIERVTQKERIDVVVEEDKRFNILKTYAQSLQINTNILDKVNALSHLVPENTLGVHIRLTDMNIIHPKYGVFHYEDYLRKIKEYIEKFKITTVFVASDNWESIEKLKKDLTGVRITYLPDAVRVLTEKADNYQHQYDMFSDLNALEQTLIDVLLLSKSTYFIHRISNYANFALLRSKSIKTSFNLSKNRKYP